MQGSRKIVSDMYFCGSEDEFLTSSKNSCTTPELRTLLKVVTFSLCTKLSPLADIGNCRKKLIPFILTESVRVFPTSVLAMKASLSARCGYRYARPALSTVYIDLFLPTITFRTKPKGSESSIKDVITKSISYAVYQPGLCSCWFPLQHILCVWCCFSDKV